MKLPEEIRQILNQHTVDTGSDSGDIIPSCEVGNIIADILDLLQGRGYHYPQSRSLGGGWWVFIPDDGLTDQAGQ